MGVGHFINDLSFLPCREFLAKEREFPPQKFVRVGSLTDSEITVLAPMKFFANFAGFSGIFFCDLLRLRKLRGPLESRKMIGILDVRRSTAIHFQ